MVALAEARGSWSIDEGIAKRWDAAGLNVAFRECWPNPTDPNYEPLNDGEARPTPPGPYCVYEKSTPVILGQMSGADTTTATTENQLQMVTVQFTIHAKSTSSESGKSICKTLAKKVADAFDPDVTLELIDDRHVYTNRGPDFHNREGDEEWSWVLLFDIVIDAEYDQPTPLPGLPRAAGPTTTAGQIQIEEDNVTVLSNAEIINFGAGFNVSDAGNKQADVVVPGTANRITVTGTGVDIASTYVGQTSITTLGTIVTGTWNAGTLTATVDTATATPITAKSSTADVSNPVATFSVTTSGDDPAEHWTLQRVTTTSATAGTAAVTPVIADDSVVRVTCEVTGRRTGGSSGTPGDGWAYVCRRVLKRTGGTLSTIGPPKTEVIGESQNELSNDPTRIIANDTTKQAEISCKGFANNNITWHITTRYTTLSS